MLAVEDMRLWPMEEGYATEMKGLSEEELRQGKTYSHPDFAVLSNECVLPEVSTKGSQQGSIPQK